MTQCLVNICVVVYNVVVFSGEDIGGQMREMAIFGVPCWGLMVSEGVPGSNDRAPEGQLPGHASPNTGKIYAAPREVPSLPLWQLELKLLCFWFIWWWAVLKCSYCGRVFGVPSKSTNEVWILGWICQKVWLRLTPPIWDSALNFGWKSQKSVRGSNLSEGFGEEQLKCHKCHRCCGHTELSTDMKTTGHKNPFLIPIFLECGDNVAQAVYTFA